MLYRVSPKWLSITAFGLLLIQILKLTCSSRSPFLKKKYTLGVLDGMLMWVCCMENVMRLADKKNTSNSSQWTTARWELDWLLNARRSANNAYRTSCVLYSCRLHSGPYPPPLINAHTHTHTAEKLCHISLHRKSIWVCWRWLM
jgi:hypothetical protein